MLAYTLGAVTCRVKVACSNSVLKKGALFQTFVCSNCTNIPVPCFIPSRALSLTKQPDMLTGGGSSSANNVQSTVLNSGNSGQPRYSSIAVFLPLLRKVARTQYFFTPTICVIRSLYCSALYDTTYRAVCRVHAKYKYYSKVIAVL